MMAEDKLNILLIEDNLADARLIFEYMQETNGGKYRFDHANLLADGLKKLSQTGYDIILLDLGLPDSSGLDSLGKIFAVNSSIPIIILTGFEDEQTALKAVQMGAQDYLIKSQIESYLLTRSISYAVERKKTQEKLRESEDHYRSLFAGNNSIMLLIDSATGLISDVNAAACRFYGYSRDEMLNMHINEINQLPSVDLSGRLMEAYSQSRLSFQFRHRLKNGEIRDVEVYTGPINKGNQKLLYSIIHDVTERKKMEEKISRVNEELEQKVAERTADLQRTNRDLHNEIQKRVSAETALKKSEEKYRTVADYTYDWETWLGPDGKYIYVSPACSRISGYSVGEFLEDPSLTLRITHPDDQEAFAKHIHEVLQCGKASCPIEFRIITRDGQVRWIEHRCQAVYDADGRWIGQRGTNRDISERKRAEEEIRLLYTITQAISETESFDDAMAMALQKICQATGWSVGEVWVPAPGNETLVFRTEFGNNNEKLKKFVDQSKSFNFRPGEGLPGSVWLSKEPVWINNISEDQGFMRAGFAREAGLNTAVAFPIFADKEIVAVFDFFMLSSCEKNEHDLMLVSAVASQLGSVIRRKQAEEKIKHSEEQYRQHLEVLIDERTNALRETNALLQEEIKKQKETERKVKSALMKEKELNELKSRFVSMVSHEYRTPLTAILSSTELIELYGYRWSEEKKKEHIEKIKNSVSYMTDMLRDVLLINRAEAGRLEFNPDNIELVEFCRNMSNDTQTITRSKCSIRFDSNVSRAGAFMDKKLLHYIFNNLLTNAVKYSAGRSEIRFELCVNDKNAFFSVADNGIGIPEEDQPRLFEQFFRGKNAGNTPGTGLGLSIVKRCVELHGGDISFVSRLGEGTTFTVSIPLNRN